MKPIEGIIEYSYSDVYVYSVKGDTLSKDVSLLIGFHTNFFR